MVFEKQSHKNLISELGFDPNRDFKDDEITSDLFLAVTNCYQEQGIEYKADEPIPTEKGVMCEEIADILAEI